jgi:hypothetical protein
VPAKPPFSTNVWRIDPRPVWIANGWSGKGLVRALAQLIDALENEEVPYMLVGALSSILYGVPRATNDAALVVEFEAFKLVEFCHRLGDDFQLDRQVMLESSSGSIRNVITSTPASFQIEVFRLGNDPHHLERFARRRRQHVPECSSEAWGATPEDVVIQKLRWARRKDLDDVVNLLAGGVGRCARLGFRLAVDR